MTNTHEKIRVRTEEEVQDLQDPTQPQTYPSQLTESTIRSIEKNMGARMLPEVKMQEPTPQE